MYFLFLIYIFRITFVFLSFISVFSHLFIFISIVFVLFHGYIFSNYSYTYFYLIWLLFSSRDLNFFTICLFIHSCFSEGVSINVPLFIRVKYLLMSRSRCSWITVFLNRNISHFQTLYISLHFFTGVYVSFLFIK